MKCPADEVLLAWLEGAPDAAEHLASCRRCELQVRQLRALTGELRGLSLARQAPAFAATLERQLARPARERWRNPLLLAAGALSAALVLWTLRATLPIESREPDVSGTFAMRGGSKAQSQHLGFEVYVHEPGRAALRLEPAQKLSAAAGYSFVVWNRSHAAQRLMLFAVDARREVHWFYPAFEAGTDPQSIEIGVTPEVRALPEGVTPDHPAPGPIRFVGLFTSSALRVSSVEARIREGGLDALTRSQEVTSMQVWRAEVRNL